MLVARIVFSIISSMLMFLVITLQNEIWPENVKIFSDILIYTFFFLLAFLTQKKYIVRKIDNTLGKHICAYLLLILCITFFYNTVWGLMMKYQVNGLAPIHLTELFAQIPLNDFSWISQVMPQWVDNILHFAYATGYSSPLCIPVLIAFYNRNFEQGWRYFISGHLLQCILIFPLLILFQTQEIWYFKHIPDGLYREFANELDMFRTSVNCFPSMHTSIAMASLIVVLRDDNRIFKVIWGVYCGLTIISTVVFPIHWVLDMVAGGTLGIISVWITNKLIKYNQENEIVKMFVGRLIKVKRTF